MTDKDIFVNLDAHLFNEPEQFPCEYCGEFLWVDLICTCPEAIKAEEERVKVYEALQIIEEEEEQNGF